MEIIVRDVEHIEKEGIDIGNGEKLKGTIIATSYDNLGGQVVQGLTECFSASYYCRICECSKEECKSMTTEDLAKYRNKENYSAQLKTISESVKVNFKNTHGVKRYCSLNNLNYFNMFANISVDIMHDLNEGCIPFLLKHLINLLISENILSEEEIKNKIQFFDYGYTNKCNVPSIICLDKHNLGQSACQLKCLFFYIPFILHKYRNEKVLTDVWICVTSLLEICQIAYSDKLTELDLKNLSNVVHIHLVSIKNSFNVTLLPKHHFLTHYATIVRKMGPLIHLSMMRFEAKHKVLKDFANATKNFKNIYETLALKHQKHIINNSSYTDDVNYGKIVLLNETNVINILRTYIPLADDAAENFFETKWMTFNNFKYKSGLIISDDYFLYEIFKIVLLLGEVYFVAKNLKFVEKDSYSLSIKINETSPVKYSVIEFKTLKNKKCYDKKRIEDELYVITDTLHLQHLR